MPNEFIARNGLISLSNVQVTGSTAITGSLSVNGSPAVLSSQTSSIALTAAQVTGGLGYTPYNSTNPSGYTSNTGTVTSVATSGGYGGLTLTGGTITTTGTITLGGTPTGTWPISVTGNAATATYATTLYSNDVRTISPSSATAYRATYGFTSWGNNNTSPYADYLHFRGYSDASGGADNLIMFRKDAIGMRIWQQSYGSTTAYSNYVDVLHSSNYTSYSPTLTGTGASGTWGINVTGTAGSISGFGNPTTYVSGNTIVYRDPNGYVFGNYINLTDDGNPGSGTAITSFITKQGDNYYRAASPTNAMVSIRGVASGTWGISISGGIEATQASLGYSVSGVNIDYGGHGGPQIRSQGGGAAMMSFHRPGSYAINFGLGTDNQLRTGGWSRGGNYVILDSGNYTSYSPSLTGGGASGTWGINVTGTSSNITAYSINQNLSTTSGPTFGDVYNNGWFRNYGATGVYNQSYGSHFRVSTNASHGTWEMFGYSKNGYAGLNIIDSSGYWNNHMFEGGNGGVYQENGAGWLWYYNRTYGSFTIGGATVSASYKLYVEGNIYATGVVDWASDVRKKENIVTIDNSLEKVTKLRGVYFNRIDDPNKKTQTGVIAQEVKEIMPELVNYDDMNDSYSVTYGNFAGLFIEAIKEQQKLIESQQKQIDELKSIVDNLNK